MLSDNEHWLLSFYRSSEISGAMFFARIARTLAPGPTQRDMTKHFADEAQHAWYWTDCIESLDRKPIRMREAYQDRYVEAGGLPTNLMEILCVTQVFERRSISTYGRHLRTPDLAPEIGHCLRLILDDERWHIQWVGRALKLMAERHGEARVAATLARYTKADQVVWSSLLDEYAERVTDLRLAPATAALTAPAGVSPTTRPTESESDTMSTEFEQTIRERIASVANIPEARITPQSTLADLMVDSLATVEVLVDLQEEFDVLLDEQDLEHLVTVADLVGLVERHSRAGVVPGD